MHGEHGGLATNELKGDSGEGEGGRIIEGSSLGTLPREDKVHMWVKNERALTGNDSCPIMHRLHREQMEAQPSMGLKYDSDCGGMRSYQF